MTPQQPGGVVTVPGAQAAAPDGALTFADETLDFSATLPAGPVDDPVLKQVRAKVQAKLDAAQPAARTGAQERKAAGGMEMAWEAKIDWDYTAKAGGIVSLVGTSYEFTGGAHGMTFTETLIARADTGETMTFESMLMPSRAPSPALTIAICEALKAEKVARMDSPTIMDEPIVCAGPGANIPLNDARIALAPSSDADRFGGAYVFFEPYAVGSYAEGSYTLTVPQVVFREDLRKEFQPLFSGKPVPPADN
jgi:hypothetical protein